MRVLGVRNSSALVALMAAWPITALAQDVVITLDGSNMELRGEIVSFDGETLTLASTIGTVSFPLSEITCDGLACPVIASEAPGEYGVVLDPSLPTDMLVDLVTSFAASAGLSASPVDSDGIEVAAAGGDAETFRLFSTSGTAVGAAAELSLVAGIGDGSAGAEGARLIGRGALVILADESLELNAISLEQLADIYSGQVTDWRQLRRRAGPVAAHLREGDVADFEAVVLTPRGLSLGASVRIVPNDTDMDGLLDQMPGAIAMTGLASNRATRVVGIAESCGLNHEATPFEVASGEYPLVQHLRAEGTSGGVELHPLFDHALTPEGQQIVTRYGYAGIATEMAEADRSRDWLGNALKFAELASLTGGADLSVEVG
ncbi:MAG: substrate-binding domain-containing protein, partial [Pseudomonadota bacterium]